MSGGKTGDGLAARRIVLCGAAINVLLIGLKFGAGMSSKSPALLAEANHSLFDLIADLVTFLAVRESSKAPSSSYPHGRVKVS